MIDKFKSFVTFGILRNNYFKFYLIIVLIKNNINNK